MAFDSGGIVFKVDISGGIGDEDMRAAGRGFYFLEFDPGDRVEIRRFVDGDRCVPVSRRLDVRAEFLRDDDDPVQRALFTAAENGTAVRFICGEGEFSASGCAVPVIGRVFRGDIRGVCYSIRLET